jgi:hypothetical protein
MIGKTSVPIGGIDFSLITWGGGSESEIKAMLEAHYSGKIDVVDYWKVGDTRTASLAAISSGTTSEAQSAQTIDLVIIGINHDDLETTNGTRSKAAITVQTKNCLATTGYMHNSKYAYDTSLWSNSKRRSWCNSEFKNALPSYLQNLIKPVTKYTNRIGNSSYRSHNSSTESCYLLSEWEVFGCGTMTSSNYGNLDADGTQYKYMETQSNRIKYLGTSTSANMWWTRTSYVNDTYHEYFVRCYTSGSSYNGLGYASNTDGGVVPGFSL